MDCALKFQKPEYFTKFIFKYQNYSNIYVVLVKCREKIRAFSMLQTWIRLKITNDVDSSEETKEISYV